MPGGRPGFAFTRSPDELRSDDHDPKTAAIIDAIADLIWDQNSDIEELSYLMLSGSRGTETITAAAGGVAVTFTDISTAAMTFRRVPTVLLTMVDGAGAVAIVKGSTTTTTGFTVQIYLAGVEQTSGDYTFNWLALV